MVRPLKRPGIRTAIVLACALALGGVTVASAATPDKGTVSPTSPTLTWQGDTYATSAVPDPALCDLGTCDEFTLTSDVAPSYWDTKIGGAEVGITWADATNDFDLYIYDSTGKQVASSAAGSTTYEKAVISKASGTYRVVVVPYLVTNADYKGTATFVSQDSGSGGDPASRTAAYHPVTISGPLPKDPPQNTQTRYNGAYPVFAMNYVGRDAAEPTIGVDKDGVAYYAAATFDSAVGTARTEIRRSTDGGTTWEKKTPQIAGNDVPPTTLDPYVYVEEDSGRVFDLDLYVASAYLAYSDDKGESYQTNPLASGPNIVNDHQTLFAGPPPAGFTTLDPKFPEILYYCFNRVADSSCSRSLDGGKTFLNTGTPAFTGVNSSGQLCGGLHGHVATDSDGRVFLPRGYCGSPYVAVSSDAGTTWKQVKVSEHVGDDENQSSIAADAAGNLYYTWVDSRDKLPYLAISTDHGMTWGDPKMIAPPGVHEAQWPTVAAGDNGKITIGFPGTTVADRGDKTRPWNYYVAISLNATAADPLFVSNTANDPADPVHRGDCPGRCGNMFDFLDVVASPHDGMTWATVVDTCVDTCATDPKSVGYDEGTGADNAASASRGMAIRQISGPALFGTTCIKRKCKPRK
jgi:hypothetical protein